MAAVTLAGVVAQMAQRVGVDFDSAAVAVEVAATGERLTYRALDRRSNKLARALVRAGVLPGNRVAVLCCPDHVPDLVVGYLAAHKAGAVAVVLPVDTAAVELRRALRSMPVRVVLACGEGLSPWRLAGLPGLVIGDGPNVAWWKALELREPGDPLPAVAAAGDMVASGRGGRFVLPALAPHEVLSRAWLSLAAPAGGHLWEPAALATSEGLHDVALPALLSGETLLATPAGVRWRDGAPSLDLVELALA